jgi:hypothetical protein
MTSIRASSQETSSPSSEASKAQSCLPGGVFRAQTTNHPSGLAQDQDHHLWAHPCSLVWSTTSHPTENQSFLIIISPHSLFVTRSILHIRVQLFLFRKLVGPGPAPYLAPPPIISPLDRKGPNYWHSNKKRRTGLDSSQSTARNLPKDWPGTGAHPNPWPPEDRASFANRGEHSSRDAVGGSVYDDDDDDWAARDVMANALEDGSCSRQGGFHNVSNVKARKTGFVRPPLPTNRGPWSSGDQAYHHSAFAQAAPVGVVPDLPEVDDWCRPADPDGGVVVGDGNGLGQAVVVRNNRGAIMAGEDSLTNKTRFSRPFLPSKKGPLISGTASQSSAFGQATPQTESGAEAGWYPAAGGTAPSLIHRSASPVVAADAPDDSVPPGLLDIVVKQCTPILDMHYTDQNRRLAHRYLREGRWYHQQDAGRSEEWWVRHVPGRVHVLMAQVLERTQSPEVNDETNKEEENQVPDGTPNALATAGRGNEAVAGSVTREKGPFEENDPWHAGGRWATPTPTFGFDLEVSSHKESHGGLGSGRYSTSPGAWSASSMAPSPLNFFQPPNFPADMGTPTPPTPGLADCPGRTTPSETTFVQQTSIVHPPSPPKIGRGLTKTSGPLAQPSCKPVPIRPPVNRDGAGSPRSILKSRRKDSRQGTGDDQALSSSNHSVSWRDDGRRPLKKRSQA